MPPLAPPPRSGRRPKALPVLLAVAVGLGLTAGVVARGFVSPAQQAAGAAPPVPSLITARVDYGVLPVQVVLRADVSNGNPVTVKVPSDLAGGNPVVTSVAVSAGEQVRDGQLLGTVAELPAFVMSGVIPAFRNMVPGTSGVDVLELQQGLAAAGYGTETDPQGLYGPGTAAAVLELYQAAGVQPDVSSGARQAVASTSAALPRATAVAVSAEAKLAADKKDAAPASAIAADRSALAAAKAALGMAQAAAVAARSAAEPAVPLGEVAFMKRLPAQVLSVARLGDTVGQGGLAVIGSGVVKLTAPGSQAETGQLRRGMTATATSDTSGATLHVQVSQVTSGHVVFVPAGQVPSGMVGQNVQVVVATGRVKAFIVPVAALSTSGSGQVYVTVAGRSGHQRVVWVRLGLQSGGQQAVSPLRGALRAGDQVVIGEQAR